MAVTWSWQQGNRKPAAGRHDGPDAWHERIPAPQPTCLPADHDHGYMVPDMVPGVKACHPKWSSKDEVSNYRRRGWRGLGGGGLGVWRKTRRLCSSSAARTFRSPTADCPTTSAGRLLAARSCWSPRPSVCTSGSISTSAPARRSRPSIARRKPFASAIWFPGRSTKSATTS